MRPVQWKAVVCSCLVCAASLGGSGCTSKGYIIAAIQSVIGLDVSENPQTQVPHIRFGFVRSQLYYIPTGQTPTGSATAGQASDTPTLVSDIYVDITPLKHMLIKERFAVGKEAVESPAARSLFQEAVQEQLAREHRDIDDIMNKVNKGGTVDGTELKKLIPSTGLGEEWVNKFAEKPVAELRKELEGPLRRTVPRLAANLKN